MIEIPMWEEASFGPFTLSPSTRRLDREGVPVPLGARTLDILIALVESHGRPLSKREIMAKAWPDATVGEASLRFHVASLREALADGEDGARYVATLTGRGYCFVAPVSLKMATVAPSSPSTGNLPLRPSLIGRKKELADIVELLSRERIITIVGAGGVGKTRLAIAIGAQSAAVFPDGVWLIDLAAVAEPSMVISAIATTFDLARGASQLSASLIVSALRDRRLLLILDNCEHLVVAAAELSEALVQGVPGLVILATSQESLRLEPEKVYRLDPLGLPPTEAADIVGYEAIDLFTYRAAAADRRFALSETNAGVVVEICRHLDGMPLALEMAAAHVPSLGLEGLRVSLEARLHVLSRALRTADVRHQTLRNTVEWSISLLDETEALVFRCLGIFSSTFALTAAMDVVAAGQMNRWAVAEALARLVDKSVVTLEHGEIPRYRLLETLRLYARELLQVSGDWDKLAESHARHFREVFAPAREAWQTKPDPEWRSAYLPELDNLRSALDWALADPTRRELAIALSGAAGFIWQEIGLLEEAQRNLDGVARALDGLPPSALAATVQADTGYLLTALKDFDEAQTLFQRAAATFQRMGDEAGFASATLGVAYCKVLSGRPPKEAELSMKGVYSALSIAGHKRLLCTAVGLLGNIALYQQDFEKAVDNFSQLADLAKQLKSVRQEGAAATNMALLDFYRGDFEKAIDFGRAAVRIQRDITERAMLPRSLHNLAVYLFKASRLDEARLVAEEALLALQSQADAAGMLWSLQLWAFIAAEDGRFPEAARLMAWTNVAYESVSQRRESWVQETARLRGIIAAKLTDDEMGAYVAEGIAWDQAHALSFTFDRIIRALGRPS